MLKVDFCSYEAAKYAVMNWHYSKAMPAGKLVKIGVWEDGAFIGCVLFGRGSNMNIGSPFGLSQVECCELVRIAMDKHKTFVSRIIRLSIKKLQETSKGIRLVISYADTGQGHAGKVYQASNWIYIGMTKNGTAQILVNGKLLHKRTACSFYGTSSAELLKGEWVQPPEKHRYIYPLDRAMRRQVLPLSQPYPKCEQLEAVPTHQGRSGGSIPSVRSLQHTGGKAELING